MTIPWLGIGVAHANLINTNAPQAMIVTETSADNTVQATGTIGAITNAAGSSSGNLSSAPLANANALAVVPANPGLDTTYQNDQDAQNALTAYLNQYLPAIGQAMATAMKGHAAAVSMAYFTFIQDVKIANPNGAPTKAQVFATTLVEPSDDQSGYHYQFLGSSINNNTINVLYAQYEQSQNAYYLPSGWTLPNAGETQWELFTITDEGNSLIASATPVNGTVLHYIQNNGAYNGQVTNNGSKQSVSYAGAIQSWITNQVKPLMQQNNASYAVASYDEQVKAARNSSGSPIMAISVNNRTFVGNCTNASLNNSGQYGYLLNVEQDNYLVQSNGAYSPLSQTQTNSLSPTQNFSQSAQLPSGTTEGQAVNDVAFPIAPYQGQIVNYTSGTPIPASDYTYVAPLQEQNAQGQETTEIDSMYGWMNVCISPTITTYNGAPFSEYVPPSPGGKYYGPQPGYSLYSTTDDNITPFTLNGVPQQYVCNYNASGIPGGGGNCALENDIVTYLYTTPSGDGWTDYWENMFITTNGGMPRTGEIQTNYFLPPTSWDGYEPDTGAPVGGTTYKNGQLQSYIPLKPVTLSILANNSLNPGDVSTEGSSGEYVCTTGGCTYEAYGCMDKYVCGYGYSSD
jgi:hypothetical protein